MNETGYFVLPECFLLYNPLTFWELEGFNMQRKARLPTQQKLPQKEPEFRVNKATTFSKELDIWISFLPVELFPTILHNVYVLVIGLLL